jgi:hypothetical protein
MMLSLRSTFAACAILTIALFVGCGGVGAPGTGGGNLTLFGIHHNSVPGRIPTMDAASCANINVDCIGPPYPDNGMQYVTWLYNPRAADIMEYRGERSAVKLLWYGFEARVQNTAPPQQSNFYSHLIRDSGLSGTAFAHKCGSLSVNVISTKNTNPTQYITNPGDTSTATDFWNDYVVNPLAAASRTVSDVDAVFLDNDGGLGDVNGMPCHSDTITAYTYTTWVTDVTEPATANLPSSEPAIYNGLGAWPPPGLGTSPNPVVLNDAAANVIAGREEACFFDIAGSIETSSTDEWQRNENTALQMANDSTTYGKGKAWICQVHDHLNDPSTAVGKLNRMYAYASFMLTDDSPWRNIYWYISSVTGTHANVFPEVRIVCDSPSPAPGASNISTYKIAGTNTYLKTCGTIYDNGVAKGNGLVVVNTDPSNAYSPAAGSDYTKFECSTCHQLDLKNSGAYADLGDGGTEAFDGSPAPSTLPAATALIIANTGTK